MDEMSLPALPHLPAAERWRESTYALALPRSSQLHTLDDALEIYENSFRRYGVISQAYYLQLNDQDGPSGGRLGQDLESVREQAEAAYSRAVHDFEQVEIAFNVWAHSGLVSLAAPDVQRLRELLSEGRSQLSSGTPQVRLPPLSKDAPQVRLPQQRPDRPQVLPQQPSGPQPTRNPLTARPQEGTAEMPRTIRKTGRRLLLLRKPR